MTTILIIAPAVRPVIAADEILLTIFANFSTFPPGLTLAPDGEITLPTAINVSTFGSPSLRITVGEEFDIELPLTVNHPLRVLEGGGTRMTEEGETRALDGLENGIFGALEIAESPPDRVITLPLVTNGSTFPAGLEIAESPPDGRIELPSFTNGSTFPAGLEIAVATVTTGGDDDGMIGGGPIGYGLI